MIFSAALAAIVALLFASAGARAPQPVQTSQPDAAAIERGRQVLVEQCSFCHGANARGGSGGPDLTRSVVVQTDKDGVQIGQLLSAGRPETGMPKFDLPRAQVSDLAAFLHAAIASNANRRVYKILDIVVGDPKAGQEYFNGAGRCAGCHSPTGDLKAIGAKYEPVTLQQRLLLPRGRERAPGAPAAAPYKDPTSLRVAVTLPSGATVMGALVRLTDFEVTLYDATADAMRSWLRNGDSPRVIITDPLQAHLDHLSKWTDADMHNMTAYLASLK